MPAPPRRRWLRFSLRTLLVLLTALAIWLGFVTKRVHDQRRAVALLDSVGITPNYDYQARYDADGFLIFDPTRPRPPLSRFREQLGADYFFDAVAILDTRGDADSQTIAAAAARLPRLRQLHVNTAFDFRELEQVCRCTHLERLGFSIAKLSGDELQPIARLSKLERLYLLDKSSLSPDAVLMTVGRLHGLEYFWADGLTFPQESLVHLAKLEQLNWLAVSVHPLPDIKLADILNRFPALQMAGIYIQPELPDLDDDQRNRDQAADCVRQYKRLGSEIQAKLTSARIAFSCAPTIAGAPTQFRGYPIGQAVPDDQRGITP
jgi:hypothetical protein